MYLQSEGGCPHLNDRQVRRRASAQLRFAAKALPLAERDAFLRRVAGRLTGEVSGAAVQCAINLALDGLTMEKLA